MCLYDERTEMIQVRDVSVRKHLRMSFEKVTYKNRSEKGIIVYLYFTQLMHNGFKLQIHLQRITIYSCFL